ncbi:hypothetical protein AA0118_g11808 [Alternaria tenuissima]|nr:hypothetical protein AA0118_g11808 [Alternaria tenuissima]
MSVPITPTLAIPPVKPHGSSDVTAEERSSAIDFVNRNNLIMEQFQVEEILSQAAEGVVLRH